ATNPINFVLQQTLPTKFFGLREPFLRACARYLLRAEQQQATPAKCLIRRLENDPQNARNHLASSPNRSRKSCSIGCAGCSGRWHTYSVTYHPIPLLGRCPHRRSGGF